MDIEKKLDELESLEQQINNATRELRAERLALQVKLDKLDAQLREQCPELVEQANSLTQEIINHAKANQVKLTYGKYKVTSRKGYPRVSYDTKGLDRYATNHPEILLLRKETLVAPSAKIERL